MSKMKKKVMLVFGTRPEAVKMCPLIIELKKSERFEVVVCVTGQHKEMLLQVLDCFHVIPDYNLDIMKEGQTLTDITVKVLIGVREIIIKEKPDLMLVHGDTTTTYAAAMAAFYEKVTIGHVEAGLRTHDLTSPYPEEFNRQAVGVMANYHFAPTVQAKDNLIREGKQASSIYVTGNTAIDAMKYTVKEKFEHPLLDWAKNSRLILLTTHRRENTGEAMIRIFLAVKDILQQYQDVKIVFPVHKNPEIRNLVNQYLGNLERIRIVEPLQLDEMHNIISKSYLVMTDSGGLQEEAPAYDKPVLVLRNTTERPEGVEAGTLRLVGTDSGEIYRVCSELLDDSACYQTMSKAKNPYGDGTAAVQIRKILEENM